MPVSDFQTLESLFEAYRHYQRRVRGLRDSTLHDYERFARSFLRFALGEDPLDPTQLTPANVVQFVMSLRDRFSPRSMKHVRTALRSLFRFLRTQGCGDERLELAIPAVAHWRMARLPRCLTEQQLAQVLASFDPRTPCGLRDQAMVLCLSTLGLRPIEVADLHLEDIDWRRGVVRLRTRKTRRGAVLPLPREAGRAIAAYLRKKRPSDHGASDFRPAPGASSRRTALGTYCFGGCDPFASPRWSQRAPGRRLRIPSHSG